MTKIQWTNATWNPTVGCSIVSKECTNCYAMKMAQRLAAMADKAQDGVGRKSAYQRVVRRDKYDDRPLPVWNDKVVCLPEALQIPLRWRKPRMVFVNSMSDLFHETVPFAFVDQVFAVMALCPQHTFQVLTKRPDRMAEYLLWADVCARELPRDRVDAIAAAIDDVESAGFATKRLNVEAIRSMVRLPLPNVWLGVSVGIQSAVERIDPLRRTPAAVRFLSCEPLIQDVRLGDLSGIHWVIAGGESGGRNKVRPCPVERILSIVDECDAHGVPVFVKQLGSFPTIDVGTTTRLVPLQNKHGGDWSEWPLDRLKRREFPEVAAA